MTRTFIAVATRAAIGSWLWYVLFSAGVAYAAEVKLLSPSVMKPMLTKLGGEFERTTGHTLTVTYDAAGAVRRRVESGEITDVLILQKPVIDAFAKQGRLAANTTASLARSGVAVAVRKGAARPDISSVEAFKQSLLAAKSIAYFGLVSQKCHG
jgi:molybdate transport system substrate-binding protein